MELSSFDTEKPWVIVINREVPDLGNSDFLPTLAQHLRTKYNLITIGARELDATDPLHKTSALFLRMEKESESQREISRLVEASLHQHKVVYAISTNLADWRIVAALAEQFIPTITLVDKLESFDPYQPTLKALGWTAQLVFADQQLLEQFCQGHPPLRDRPLHVFVEVGMAHYASQLDRIGVEAVATMRQRREDHATLLADPSFNVGCFLHPNEAPIARNNAISQFLAYWCSDGATPNRATPFNLRRPTLGFHPQSYAIHHPELKSDEVNPLADFVRKQRPGGPWVHPVAHADFSVPKKTTSKQLRTVIHAHFHYPGLIDHFLTKLAVNRAPCDLLLSTNSETKAEVLHVAAANFDKGRVEIRVVPNRGRDIAPLLTSYGQGALQDYDAVGHFHAKLSRGDSVGAAWCEFLWQHLLGDHYPMMDIALASFAADDRLGLIFADEPSLFGWDTNRPIAEALAKRMSLQGPLPTFFDFPVGTMFWARPRALAPLFELGLKWEDYPEEPLPDDGTMLHALERLISLAAETSGFTFATQHVPGVTWSVYGDA